MKLAVMQPYFFPYIGYFQLINAVDKFVIYDDVSYIKKGWINRNYILMNCQPLRFTIPLSNASQNRDIIDTRLTLNSVWREKLLRKIRHAYSKAPHFDEIIILAEAVIQKEHESIRDLALASLDAVINYLGICTEIQPTSREYNNSKLKGEARVLDICRIEAASAYYNLSGGYELYNQSAFNTLGISLHFIKPLHINYRQFDCKYVPDLSILDVLMFNDRETVVSYLTDYEFV